MFPCLASLRAFARSETRGCTCSNGLLFKPFRSPNWKAHNPKVAIALTNLITRLLLRCALRTGACSTVAGMVSFTRALVVSTRVADAPDGVRTVIGYQQRSVLSHGDPDRPPPHVLIVDHKSGDKIFVLAAGPGGLVQRYADHLISGAYRSVPRTVLGCENISLIFGRE